MGGTQPVGLTRDAVIDKAIEIVERDGVKGLSMRKLASALGVKPASIYWHVGNRDALLDAITARVAKEIDEGMALEGTPAEQLHTIGDVLRRTLLERARLTDLVRNGERSVALLIVPRTMALRAFREAGLTNPADYWAARSFLFHVTGFALCEQMVGDTVQRVQVGIGEGTTRLADDNPPPLDRDALFRFSTERLVQSLLDDPATAVPGPA